MKTLKCLFFSIAICLLFVSPIWAQQTVATNKIYKNIEIEKFSIRQGVEFPSDKIDSLTNSVVKALRNSKKFSQVSLVGEVNKDQTNPAEAAQAPTLRISGEVIKYVKGNRATRYIIGMGMGATKIIADIKFVDAQSSAVVLQQTVDGDVVWGIFGGDSDSAKGGIANEIVKIAKRNFTDAQNKKSK